MRFRAAIAVVAALVGAGDLARAETAGALCARLAAHPLEPGLNGLGVPMDMIDGPRALEACSAAVADDRTGPNLYRLSRAQSRVGDMELSFRTLDAAVAEDYPHALAAMAYSLLAGIGTAQNVEGAGLVMTMLTWKKPVPPFAHLVLGFAAERGLGMPKDTAEAATQYRAAAVAGDPSAMAQLAWLLLFDEQAVGPDSEALDWLDRARGAGVASAAYVLGTAYATGTGVPRDPA